MYPLRLPWLLRLISTCTGHRRRTQTAERRGRGVTVIGRPGGPTEGAGGRDRKKDRAHARAHAQGPRRSLLRMAWAWLQIKVAKRVRRANADRAMEGPTERNGLEPRRYAEADGGRGKQDGWPPPTRPRTARCYEDGSSLGCSLRMCFLLD